MVGGSGLDSAELVAGRPRLPVPGKSRLKTAPTIQNSRYKTTKFFFDLTGRLFAGGLADT